jgi:EAL domain-containing protein (putative c-di-GMP-specific phosphodiesterase class I)
VIAEGVETREQLEFLRAHGCDEIQGYFFSPALPQEEFTRLVEKQAEASVAVAGRS